MSVEQPDPYATRRDARPGEPSFVEIAENAVRKIVTSVVVAAGFVALAIYFQPAPPRYQAAVGDGRVVRIDTKTGTVIACDADGCAIVLRRGQRLEARPHEGLLPRHAPENAQAPAVPAPGAAPAAPAPAAAPTTE